MSAATYCVIRGDLIDGEFIQTSDADGPAHPECWAIAMDEAYMREEL